MASAGFHSASLVLLVVALVFTILATISSPVVKSFGLGVTDHYKYGIFGYCSSKSCSKATYPYTLSGLDDHVKWFLAKSSRDKLAKIFVVAPISAGFNLFTVIALVLAHFLPYVMLLVALALNVASFALNTLIGIIVVLVFYPKVGWTGWILIGAAAASLVSIPLLVLALRFRSSDNDDEDEASDDLTAFDDKFASIAPATGATSSGFVAPGPSGTGRQYDETSSISKDYDFKPLKPNPYSTQVSKTISNSSIYNSNPQLANDFTQHQKPGSTSGTSYYEDLHANLVSGPNTPVMMNKQIAPNLVATSATPSHDGLNIGAAPLPYPAGTPRTTNKAPYAPNNYGGFEHRPEVEGQGAFNEFQSDYDPNRPRSDELDSDNDSDFTSVSQRAINPKYNPQQQLGYFPQSQHQVPAPQHQQYQKNFYPNVSQYSPQFQPVPQQGMAPQQGYFPQQQSQGHFNPPPQSRGPTVSDNALNSAPDFAIGFQPRRKAGPGATPRNGLPPGGRYNQAPGGNRMNANALRGGDGPYAFR